MLTLFFGSSSKVFQKILHHFIKAPTKIIDLTYGAGNSWKGFEFNTLNGIFEVIKCDIREELDIDIVVDLKKRLPFKNREFDCAYFDPPYYFIESVNKFDIRDKMYNNEKEVFWTQEEMNAVLNNLKKEIPRILKEQGVLICKIMDGYQGKDTYFPNHYIFYNYFSQVLKPEATFIVPIQRRNIPKLIKTNHIYYQVFRKTTNI